MSLRADLPEVKRDIFSGWTYDKLKDAVTIGIPAATTFYSTLAILFSWPFSSEVVGVGAAAVTFLGILLKLSSARFQANKAIEAAAEVANKEYDGVFIANDPNPNVDTFRTEFTNGLVDMTGKDEIVLKVENRTPRPPSQ